MTRSTAHKVRGTVNEIEFADIETGTTTFTGFNKSFSNTNNGWSSLTSEQADSIVTDVLDLACHRVPVRAVACDCEQAVERCLRRYQ